PARPGPAFRAGHRRGRPGGGAGGVGGPGALGQPRPRAVAAGLRLGGAVLGIGAALRLLGAGLPGGPLPPGRRRPLRPGAARGGERMNELLLTGLVGSHPLGALAAFGLLRCCEELDGFRGARLGWRPEQGWCAVLQADGAVDVDQLVGALAARQRHRADAPELNWAASIKTACASYKKALRRAGQELLEGRRDFADCLAAFACELAADDRGQVQPTVFYMTSGRQEFLAEARKLARRLAEGVSVGRRRKGPEELFREALLGPWRYEDPQHSL